MYIDQLTIGGLLESLRRFDSEADVFFDFCRTSPTRISSYRGYYDHPALGWTDTGRAGEITKVRELIEELEAALGKSYEGWKGGTYHYNLKSSLFIDNPGNATDTYPVGVESRYGDAVIVTAMGI